ncbi:uncharacterized protein LOC143847299 [Tasmannia lanceolata]|uniref:uncharacterized protein LOC143847299 n=1 Tax=Tasmannia lanceolata TaxID=3420 RepID=UPI004063C47B
MRSLPQHPSTPLRPTSGHVHITAGEAAGVFSGMFRIAPPRNLDGVNVLWGVLFCWGIPREDKCLATWRPWNACIRMQEAPMQNTFPLVLPFELDGSSFIQAANSLDEDWQWICTLSSRGNCGSLYISLSVQPEHCQLSPIQVNNTQVDLPFQKRKKNTQVYLVLL